MIYAAAIIAACFFALLALILTAPEGHETDDGFVLGPDPRFEQISDAGQDDADRRPFAPVLRVLHSSGVTYD